MEPVDVAAWVAPEGVAEVEPVDVAAWVAPEASRLLGPHMHCKISRREPMVFHNEYNRP